MKWKADFGENIRSKEKDDKRDSVNFLTENGAVAWAGQKEENRTERKIWLFIFLISMDECRGRGSSAAAATTGWRRFSSDSFCLFPQTSLWGDPWRCVWDESSWQIFIERTMVTTWHITQIWVNIQNMYESNFHCILLKINFCFCFFYLC